MGDQHVRPRRQPRERRDHLAIDRLVGLPDALDADDVDDRQPDDDGACDAGRATVLERDRHEGRQDQHGADEHADVGEGRIEQAPRDHEVEDREAGGDPRP